MRGLWGWFAGMLFLLNILLAKTYANEVVVLGIEAMPLCGTVDGKSSGILVDILNEATRYGAPKFKFSFEYPWARVHEVIHMQKKGALIALIPLTHSPEREKEFKWITPIIPNEQRLVTLRQATRIKNLDEAKKLSISIIRSHYLIPMLKENGFDKLEESGDALMNSQKLLMKRVDGLIDTLWVIQYNWYQLGQDPNRLQIGPAIGKLEYIYLGADKSFPDTVAKSIDSAMKKMRMAGKIDEIYARWGKNIYSVKQNARK